MNERIKQLAEQADLHSTLYFRKDQLRKFAELLVRECAKLADQERSNSLGCGYITKTKGMQILEHFGFEK
jgi:hypothetical protein